MKVIHSLFDDILIECEAHEYSCRIVDANVKRVLPREVAQAIMVPTALVSRSLVRDVGNRSCLGLDPLYLCSSGASRPKAQLETFPACMLGPGIPQGQPSYRRALHKYFSFYTGPYKHLLVASVLRAELAELPPLLLQPS